VPRTDDEGLKFPHRYFEFHLRVNRKDGNADDLISPEELSLLRDTSSRLAKKYGVPVPLSYNAAKEGRQRFFNFRIGWCGSETALKVVDCIKREIESSTAVKLLHVGKSHNEYVWFDDFRALDRGWIDFTAEVLFLLSAYTTQRDVFFSCAYIYF
jgi:hypothetical protein